MATAVPEGPLGLSVHEPTPQCVINPDISTRAEL
jgi:hypothetical protein